MEFELSISWRDYARAVFSLFAIINPFSTIPVFLSLTAGDSPAERRMVAARTAASTFLIMLIAYLAGAWILWFFSISIASFRVAGGLLIMSVAFSMLQAKQSSMRQTPEEAEEARTKKAIAVVPLALPLMAGPGTISMIIVVADHTQTWYDDIAVVIAMLAIALVVWLVLSSGATIAKALGKTGMNVATRIMGLILAAIAVEFIVNGLAQSFPGWLD